MSDFIERQEALKELAAYIHLIDKTMGKGTLTDDDCMEAAKSVLGEDEIPAVQPDHTADIGKKVSISCSHENDLISRQAAIDLFPNDALEWDTKGGYIAPHLARRMIEELPPAQPGRKKSDWIPVERELPNDLEEANVTWVNHEPEPYYEFIKSKPFTASAVFYKSKWYWYSSVCADVLGEYGRNDVDKVDDTIEITAWMPLPEPYQGGEKDDR